MKITIGDYEYKMYRDGDDWVVYNMTKDEEACRGTRTYCLAFVEMMEEFEN